MIAFNQIPPEDFWRLGVLGLAMLLTFVLLCLIGTRGRAVRHLRMPR